MINSYLYINHQLLHSVFTLLRGQCCRYFHSSFNSFILTLLVLFHRFYLFMGSFTRSCFVLARVYTTGHDIHSVHILCWFVLRDSLFYATIITVSYFAPLLPRVL